MNRPIGEPITDHVRPGQEHQQDRERGDQRVHHEPGPVPPLSALQIAERSAGPPISSSPRDDKPELHPRSVIEPKVPHRGTFAFEASPRPGTASRATTLEVVPQGLNPMNLPLNPAAQSRTGWRMFLQCGPTRFLRVSDVDLEIRGLQEDLHKTPPISLRRILGGLITKRNLSLDHSTRIGSTRFASMVAIPPLHESSAGKGFRQRDGRNTISPQMSNLSVTPTMPPMAEYGVMP